MLGDNLNFLSMLVLAGSPCLLVGTLLLTTGDHFRQVETVARAFISVSNSAVFAVESANTVCWLKRCEQAVYAGLSV